MPKIKNKLLSVAARHPLQAVLLSGAVLGLPLLSYDVSQAQIGAHAPKSVQQPVHHIHITVTAKKPATETAVPAPAPPAPVSKSPGTTITSAVSKPAASSAAPAAVAAVAASPGTGVSTLTPAPSSPASSGRSSTSSSSGGGGSGSAAGGGSGSSSGSGASSSSTPSYTSLNWAGYMASGGTYTAVSGQWTVPDPTGNSTTNTADAAWIGIGGVSTSDLIQVGTEDTVSAAGQVSSAVFYELLPDTPIYPSSILVAPGDAMSASLSETGTNQWKISISDITAGQSFAATVTYTSSHSSAEWIEEDPSYSSSSLVPFDHFGTVPFSTASLTDSGTTRTLAAANAASITLVDRSGNPLATPSALGSDGQSFSVSRN